MGHSLEATERTFAEALEANGGGAFESLRQRRATLLNTHPERISQEPEPDPKGQTKRQSAI